MSVYQATTQRASILCQKADAVRQAIHQSAALNAAQLANGYRIADSYEEEARKVDKFYKKSLKKNK